MPKGRRPRIETDPDGRRWVTVTIAPSHAARDRARRQVETSACSKVHWWFGVDPVHAEAVTFELRGTSVVRVLLPDDGQARRQATPVPDEASGRTHASP